MSLPNKDATKNVNKLMVQKESTLKPPLVDSKIQEEKYNEKWFFWLP